MQVLSVASEIYPLVKTGGLADVVGALPAALARQGVEVRTVVPGYPAIMDRLVRRETVRAVADLFGGPANIVAGLAAELDLFVIDAPHLFDRPGNPYVGPDGVDWPDNAQRFAALARVGAELAHSGATGFAPDILHAHDWQAGLAPAYLHYGGGRVPGVVMTVHNLAFQGSFPPELLGEIGLPPESFAVEGVEFFGRISYLKAGLQFADRITTVSPTYAAEIATLEAGMGLEGLLQARASALSGVLNGIDDAVWDPGSDPHLSACYAANTLDRRGRNKRQLQARFGIAENPETALFGVISRLSWQKGLDVLLAALPGLLAQGASLVLLGSGDAALENAFRAATAAAPDRVGVVVGYDEALAHQVQGGADALLVPSRFEPCGLTQLCAMRYGAVPVVARVGGLADTVIDANEAALAAGVATGFQFAPVSGPELERAVTRALSVWKDRTAWRRLQANGMSQDLGWSRPAAQYARLYREVAERPS